MLYALIWGFGAVTAFLIPLLTPLFSAQVGASVSHRARRDNEGIVYKVDDGRTGIFLPEELALLGNKALRETLGESEQEIIERGVHEAKKKARWASFFGTAERK